VPEKSGCVCNAAMPTTSDTASKYFLALALPYFRALILQYFKVLVLPYF
jgi:hypothetical protein